MTDDPWTCHVCLARYPVPSLARCCEHEHHRLRDANPDRTDTDDDQETEQ